VDPNRSGDKAAGELAGAPAVPNRVFTSERRDPGPFDKAAGEGAGAPAVPNRVFTSERRDPGPTSPAGTTVKSGSANTARASTHVEIVTGSGVPDVVMP
jgi:hypothetical protein